MSEFKRSNKNPNGVNFTAMKEFKILKEHLPDISDSDLLNGLESVRKKLKKDFPEASDSYIEKLMKDEIRQMIKESNTAIKQSNVLPKDRGDLEPERPKIAANSRTSKINEEWKEFIKNVPEVDTDYIGPKKRIINPEGFKKILEESSLLPKGFSQEVKDKANKEFERRNKKNIQIRKLPTKTKEKAEADKNDKKFAPYLEKNALPNSLRKKRALLTTKKEGQKI